MADWICKTGDIRSLDLPYHCFSLLGDKSSVDALEELYSNYIYGSVKNDICSKTKFKELVLSTDEKSINKLVNGECENNNSTVTDNVHEKFAHRSWAIAREDCPFCKVKIPLLSLQTLKCSNGHAHFRCCLTLKVSIATNYRRCTACGRKASCKNLDGELSVESIMLNIDICPFCGCRFIDPFT